MKYRQLGFSDITVSAIGMGCWAIGGKWGPTDDGESVKTIRKALEVGVNFFDTADFYGFGHSEEILGKVLEKNQKAIIATKVGLRWNKKGKIRHDLSSGYIKDACKASLKRLKRDTIDLYMIHWPDPDRDFSEAIEGLDGLVKEGLVRYGGACNLNFDQLKEISKKSWFVAYQDKLNFFETEAKSEIIPYCTDNNIAYVGYGPLFKGMLTGKFKEKPVFKIGDHRRHAKRFNERFNYFKERIDRIAQIAEANNLTTTEISLAALLSDERITTLIPGARTEVQIIENARAADVDKNIAKKLAAQIEEIIDHEPNKTTA